MHKEHIGTSAPPKPRGGYLDAVARFTTQLAAAIRRREPGRSSLTALLGRYGAHVAILVVVVGLGTAERITASPPTAAADRGPLSAPAAAEPIATPTTAPIETTAYQPPARQGIAREAHPITTIPERLRLDVIAYTVQEGDSIYLIAEAFGLSPYTVVWSNMEILQGAPWLLQPGLTLYIPPTDGAYHTVRADESASDIATAYEVDATVLYNIWNPIEPGEPLAEGTLLVIPSGIGPDFDWEPPPPPTAVPAPARPNAGVAAAVQPPVAPAASATSNGWFILPTGSYGVSGYVFADYRNPTHIGLDYRCRLGDPIYAADGGTVVFAGWGGGYGNLVRVDHGNGFVTYYAHFSSFAAVLGQAVAQGQVVGYCGTTGASTGPHLHYEIRLYGVPQNPALYEP